MSATRLAQIAPPTILGGFEYLVTSKAITAFRVFFSAAPLNIPGADDAPSRIYAIEGLLPP